MAELLDSLTKEEVRRIIYEEVPRLVRSDPEIRVFLERLISEVGRERFSDRRETEDRFEKMLAELKAQREDFREEMRKLREESERKWQELKEESDRKWRELKEEIKELKEETKELKKETKELKEEIKKLHHRYETGIRALGSRWGVRAESAFREAIKGILEESFPVKVERYLTKDEEGEVFGRPDQVELDLIIRDGEVIVAEIKSSMSKSEIYTFERKVRFYEKREGREVKRKIVISPMVTSEAQRVAKELGIEVYTYPDSIEKL